MYYDEWLKEQSLSDIKEIIGDDYNDYFREEFIKYILEDIEEMPIKNYLEKMLEDEDTSDLEDLADETDFYDYFREDVEDEFKEVLKEEYQEIEDDTENLKALESDFWATR